MNREKYITISDLEGALELTRHTRSRWTINTALSPYGFPDVKWYDGFAVIAERIVPQLVKGLAISTHSDRILDMIHSRENYN